MHFFAEALSIFPPRADNVIGKLETIIHFEKKNEENAGALPEDCVRAASQWAGRDAETVRIYDHFVTKYYISTYLYPSLFCGKKMRIKKPHVDCSSNVHCCLMQ